MISGDYFVLGFEEEEVDENKHLLFGIQWTFIGARKQNLFKCSLKQKFQILH